eukprot:15152412-Heterocapsa_arctica.AAC.1
MASRPPGHSRCQVRASQDSGRFPAPKLAETILDSQPTGPGDGVGLTAGTAHVCTYVHSWLPLTTRKFWNVPGVEGKTFFRLRCKSRFRVFTEMEDYRSAPPLP